MILIINMLNLPAELTTSITNKVSEVEQVIKCEHTTLENDSIDLNIEVEDNIKPLALIAIGVYIGNIQGALEALAMKKEMDRESHING
jgi:hypothetical protein